MSTFQTIQTNVRGVDIEVEVDITPGDKGTKDSYGAPMEPDYDAEMDLIKVSVGIHEGETEIDISPLIGDEVFMEIKKKCWLVLTEQGEPDAPDTDDFYPESKQSGTSEFNRLMEMLK